MIIYIVRHAWAGEHGDPRYPDDRLRPLTADGRERFGRVVQMMVGRGLEPERIATSPLVRCRQTADLLQQYLPKDVKITELAALEPGSDLDALLGWTREQNAGAVAWVGHAPDVNELAAGLISPGDARLRFPKGAIAAVEIDGQCPAGTGVLRWFVTAKSLGC